MKLALHGYGKMGKEIERLAIERGNTITAKIDITLPPCSEDDRAATDVVIHFASASSLIDDLRPWAELHKPIVIGTTGWNDRVQEVENLARQYELGIIYAANFSIGVNIFYYLLQTAGTLFNRFFDYDVFVHEVHHKDKIDSPSGTALRIGGILLQTIQRKTELLTETSHGKIQPHQLHITSSRCGAVVGEHHVTFDSSADSIELRHSAKNRSGFALGALLAAEWIRNKKGLYTIDDMMRDLFN
ncbi:MAG TPA: 4-hydroxy-tetrahydrodipicolinate reductase [Bacteroidota bacterium]|nr:4-hydroxy-tetrahydrodipicolinate reductase [Bacteroidota bacterium]